MKKNYKDIISDTIVESIRDDYINNGLSIRKLCDKYNIKSKTFIISLIGDDIRDTSKSGKIAHKLYPERFYHSDKTKQLLREKRLAFMKAHPEQTAWRLCKGNLSYPEKCFLKYIEDRGLDKKYEIVREKSFYPYFVDFAFTDIHFAIEIDGSQHLEDERKESDNKKDELLNSLGWKVIRITANTAMKHWDEIDKIFNQDFVILENINRVGVYHEVKKYQKVEKEDNGRSRKQNEASFKQRRCEWPTKEKLEELIQNNSYCAIGRMYNVTDKTIRKWCKHYNIEIIKRKKEI